MVIAVVLVQSCSCAGSRHSSLHRLCRYDVEVELAYSISITVDIGSTYSTVHRPKNILYSMPLKEMYSIID